jgi:hypothetical protein
LPQFKLVVPHTEPVSGVYLEAGTLVGDNTPHPWTDARGNVLPPSLGMVGVDEESQSLVDQQYNDEVRNDPIFPKNPEDNTPEAATKDMTVNRPSPNVSPAQTPPRQTPNESTVPPLRRGPVGASPAAEAKAPQSGQAAVRNPLDLGASKSDEK